MNTDRFRSAALPRPAAPVSSPAAFACLPLVCLPLASPAQAMWLEALYRHAFEQAQAVARPSLMERDLLGVWN